MDHDLGFISGFIGVVIDLAIRHILDHINIALSCKKELNSLKNLLKRIEPVVTQIQQYRLTLNWKKGIRNEATAVDEWLKQLDGFLLQASTMAQECTIPRYALISRYKTSKRITDLISDITQHLDFVPLMGWASLLEGLDHALASGLADASEITFQPDLASRGFFINETLIVGQENAMETLENLVIDSKAVSPFSLIGVVGKAGSGKTLLFKTLFNSKKVRDLFCDGLLLWLSVSQSPSFTNLRHALYKQIAMQTNLQLEKDMNEEAVKILLNERLQKNRFALFLDDVWEEGAKLLEELGLVRLTDYSNSKIIVSSRNLRTLKEMGVNAQTSIATMEDLMEDDSWRLFAHHAFSYNNGNLPASIDQETAKLVCAKCGGLPLAIKTVGRAMAGIIDSHEWELAARHLPNANRRHKEDIHHRFRLSRM